MEDYNIASRIEELCNTLENALVELDEYKDDPDISIRTQICDEDIFPSLNELSDIFENAGNSTLISAVIALSDYKSASDIPEDVQKSIIKAFETTALKGGGMDVFAESVQKAISDLEPIHGATDESIEKIAQIVKEFLSDFGESRVENGGTDSESKYSAISQVFKDGCGDVISKVNDVLTKHLDNMPENEKTAILESPAGKEIFSYETKPDGSIDMDTVKAKSGMQINDNGSFTDKFGISFSGEMKAKVDIDNIEEAKEGIKEFAQLLNNLYKAQNGKQYIDEKCLGPVERNALARAIHLFADDLYKKGEDSNVDNSLEKYGKLLQSLYGVHVNQDDIEKIKNADFVEKFFEKEEDKTSSDDHSDKADSDASGFKQAEHDFTSDNTTEESGSKSQGSDREKREDKAAKSATAEQHGRSILWTKTGNPDVDKFIDKRNAYIERSSLFPIYRYSIGFSYNSMKAIIAAKNNGLEINGKVPTSFDCAMAISSFIQTDVGMSLTYAILERIFDLVSNPTDKVDKDPKSEKMETGPDRDKNIDNSKAEERKEVEKENLKDAIVKQVSKIERSFKSGESNNNTKYVGRACTSSMENIINLYGKEKGIEVIKDIVKNTMEAVRKNPAFSDKTVARMEVLFEKSYLKIGNERIDLGEILKEIFDKDSDKSDKEEEDKADDTSKDTADQEGEEDPDSKTEPDEEDDADNEPEDNADTEPEDNVDEETEDKETDDPKDKTDSEPVGKDATDQDAPENDAASNDGESVDQKARGDEPVDSTAAKEKESDAKSDNEKDVSSKDKVDKPDGKEWPTLTKDEQMLKTRLNEILSEKSSAGKVGNDGELKRIIGSIQKAEGKQNISDPVAKVIASIQHDKPDIDQGKIKAVCKGMESISKADGVSVKIKNILSKAADVLKNPSSYAVSPTVALQWELQDKFSDYIKSKASLGEVKDKIRSCFEKTGGSENPDSFLKIASNAVVNVVASLADRISSGEKAVFSRINNIMNSISTVAKTSFDKVCAALEKYGEPIKMEVEVKASGLSLVSVDKDKAEEFDKANKDSIDKKSPDKVSENDIETPGFKNKEEAKEEIKDKVTQMASNMSDVLKKEPGERTSADRDALSKPSSSYFETALNILKAYGEGEGKAVIREGIFKAVTTLIDDPKVSKEIVSRIGEAIDKNNILYLAGNKIEFINGVNKGIEIYRTIKDPISIVFPQNDFQQGLHDKILDLVRPGSDKADKDKEPEDKTDRNKEPEDKADRDKEPDDKIDRDKEPEDKTDRDKEPDDKTDRDKEPEDKAERDKEPDDKADKDRDNLANEEPKDIDKEPNEKDLENNPDKAEIDREDPKEDLEKSPEDKPDQDKEPDDKAERDAEDPKERIEQEPDNKDLDKEDPKDTADEDPKDKLDEDPKDNPDNENADPDKAAGDDNEGLDNEDNRPVDQEQNPIDQDADLKDMEQHPESADNENPNTDTPENDPDDMDNEPDKPDEEEFEKKNGGDIDSSLETPQAAGHEVSGHGADMDDDPDDDDLDREKSEDSQNDTDSGEIEEDPLDAERAEETTDPEETDFDGSDLAGAMDNKEAEEPSEETSPGLEDGDGTQGFADNVDSAAPDLANDMETSPIEQKAGQDGMDGISDAITAYTEEPDFGFSDFLDTPLTINGDEMTLGEAYENDAISNENLAGALADAISNDASNILESDELMETYSDLLSDLSDMCGNSFAETFCDAMDPFASVDETVDLAFNSIAEDMAVPDFTLDSIPDFDVMDLAEMEFDIMDNIDSEGIIGDGVDSAMQNDFDTGLDNRLDDGLNDALDLDTSDLTSGTGFDASPDLSQDSQQNAADMQTPDTSYMDNQNDFSTPDDMSSISDSVPDTGLTEAGADMSADVAADAAADAIDYATLIL